jgi:hypothetical protein
MIDIVHPPKKNPHWNSINPVASPKPYCRKSGGRIGAGVGIVSFPVLVRSDEHVGAVVTELSGREEFKAS